MKPTSDLFQASSFKVYPKGAINWSKWTVFLIKEKIYHGFETAFNLVARQSHISPEKNLFQPSKIVKKGK